MRYFISRKGIIILSILLLILIAIPIRNHTISLMNRMDRYLPNNIFVNDIHIGGKTMTEAEKLINTLENEKLNNEITITYDENKKSTESHRFKYGQLGYYADKAPILDELHTIFNTKENIIKRMWNYRRIENSKRYYILRYKIDKKKFMTALEIFDQSKLSAPKNAKYAVIKGNIQIIKEESGFVYDTEALYKKLLADTRINSAKLSTRIQSPEITAAQLSSQGIKEKVSSFTTKFDAGNAPRAANIRLAAQIINGTVLAPGETFSFNQVVGERTEQRGFREAGVYMNGKVDTGIGGGICQVSTTLYNAVLYADLHVEERYNHSLTVPYVPLSRDAAVSWGLQDLKFINNSDHHLYIHSSTSKNTITFNLFSTSSNKKVELVSTTISKKAAPVLYKNDPALEVGKQIVEDKGHDGFESQLTKKIYINGKLASTEIISRDRYQTERKIVIRGIKEPEIRPYYYYPIYE